MYKNQHLATIIIIVAKRTYGGALYLKLRVAVHGLIFNIDIVKYYVFNMVHNIMHGLAAIGVSQVLM